MLALVMLAGILTVAPISASLSVFILILLLYPLLYHNLSCHFAADRDAGILHIYNQIPADFRYYAHRAADHKAKILKMHMSICYRHQWVQAYDRIVLCHKSDRGR